MSGATPHTCSACRWWATDEPHGDRYDFPDDHGRKACWASEESEDEGACGYAIDEPAATLITKPTFGCNMWKPA